MEATMASYGRPAFDPLDLEVIDGVYEAAWAQLLALNLPRDEVEEIERHKNLRKRLFALVRPGGVEFDALYDMVLASYSPNAPRRAERTSVDS
jgi:hypothetical protein